MTDQSSSETPDIAVGTIRARRVRLTAATPKPRPPIPAAPRYIRSGSVQHSTKYSETPWTAQLRVHGETPAETIAALHAQTRELEKQLVALIMDEDES